ncbi:hypothetical protein M011DRAFT_100852 [Sporormia fimetaria CBS 119925]|uniref:Uncharacterized protein n=1 Tax=Sporormia fimetaria CBS 119925 TaxID=1340428 RepID=A0A6A6VMP5_9PLEO|nr:hypothetical protein M011DRAFT_100852 [Sporormia fimetaria CBS 119925]
MPRWHPMLQYERKRTAKPRYDPRRIVERKAAKAAKRKQREQPVTPRTDTCQIAVSPSSTTAADLEAPRLLGTNTDGAPDVASRSGDGSQDSIGVDIVMPKTLETNIGVAAAILDVAGDSSEGQGIGVAKGTENAAESRGTEGKSKTKRIREAGTAENGHRLSAHPTSGRMPLLSAFQAARRRREALKV